jgi:hypothetical protein
MEGWLILIDTIRPQPARLRAGIWRKLKAARRDLLAERRRGPPSRPGDLSVECLT